MYIKIEGNVNIKDGEIKIKTSIYNIVDIKFYMGCRQPISTCNENTQFYVMSLRYKKNINR